MKIVKRIFIKGACVNYIEPNMKTDNFKRLHKLRVKQALYGEIFSYYHDEMIFINN